MEYDGLLFDCLNSKSCLINALFHTVRIYQVANYMDLTGQDDVYVDKNKNLYRFEGIEDGVEYYRKLDENNMEFKIVFECKRKHKCRKYLKGCTYLIEYFKNSKNELLNAPEPFAPKPFKPKNPYCILSLKNPDGICSIRW